MACDVVSRLLNHRPRASAAFEALGRAGWALGMLFGLVRALFAGTMLVNVLLLPVHPRWGHWSAPRTRHRCWNRPGLCL